MKTCHIRRGSSHAPRDMVIAVTAIDAMHLAPTTNNSRRRPGYHKLTVTCRYSLLNIMVKYSIQ